MSVFGNRKNNSIAYSTVMASGKSDWLTRVEVMEAMNAYNVYDTVEVTPEPVQDKGTVWYGFRLKAFKEGKPERLIILEGELETLKARDALYADTKYYFEDKEIHDIVWNYWNQNK